MAAVKSLEILGQIQALVVDRLQVVSYKWLSRNFLVSSNQAKRLLQQFVDDHDNKVEVLYSLSGWLKNIPETYNIKLASAQKLNEAMKEFDCDCKVEVYSIQSSLPKDIAVIWNTEFIQTEDLFNQPSNSDNCLRNNRFSGISSAFVKRAINGQLVAISSTSQIKNGVGVMPAITSKIPKDERLQAQQGKVEQFDAKEGSFDNPDQSVGGPVKKSNFLKESSNAHKAKRKGVSNEKNSSGMGGSLATLWGRAPAKPKSAGHSTNNIENVAFSADAQICAEEAADTVSSDDGGYDMPHMRNSNDNGTRKRRVFIDYSDEDDNVVSLEVSPSPNEKFFSDTLQSTKSLNVETDQLNPETSANNQDGNGISDGLIESKKRDIIEASSPKAKNCFKNCNASANEKGNAPMAPKRKKVIKTRIDDRGREVTEVVWEEPVSTKDADNNIAKKDIGNNRPEAKVGTSASNNPVCAKKPIGAKQGNIFSFFKKA